MYDNNVLVRDFVPAKRDSDGAIGLLDIVNNIFYPNMGSGTFTAGPESASANTEIGTYEFMLTYPSLSTSLYNRWTQTSSPNAGTVTGFTPITTAWSGHNAGIRKKSG